MGDIADWVIAGYDPCDEDRWDDCHPAPCRRDDRFGMSYDDWMGMDEGSCRDLIKKAKKTGFVGDHKYHSMVDGILACPGWSEKQKTALWMHFRTAINH